MPADVVTAYTIEDSTITLPTPTSEEHTFAGWFTSEALTTSKSTIASGSTGNVEVWAGWRQVASWTESTKGTYYFTNSGYVWTSNNYYKNSSTATTTWKITLLGEASISIPYSINSESYDKLTITLDDAIIVNGVSGYYSSTIYQKLTAGTHTLVAKYVKDVSYYSGTDRATVTLNDIRDISY